MPLVWIVAICCTGLLACQSPEGHDRDWDNLQPTGDRDIQWDSLHLEQLPLEAIEASGVGFIHIVSDSIYYMDSQSNVLHVFDLDGQLASRHIGRGEGPGEIPSPGISSYALTPSVEHVFLDFSWNVYHFDDRWNKIGQHRIGWQSDVPPQEVSGPADPENDRAYNLDYDVADVRASDSYLYLPLSGPFPPDVDDDFHRGSNRFAEEARLLAQMDVATGEVDRLLGRLSPVFSQNETVRYFSHFHFDLLGEDGFVVSYMPDSLIYITDHDFQLQRAFGRDGRGIDRQYVTMPHQPEELGPYVNREVQDRGYNMGLKAFPERDLIFRTYSRGGEQDADGLQIYKDGVLVGDVDVPVHPDPIPASIFKVVGFAEPYFYSNVFPDPETDEMYVYRFRLDE